MEIMSFLLVWHLTALGIYIANRYPGPKILWGNRWGEQERIDQQVEYLNNLHDTPPGKTALYFTEGEGEVFQLLSRDDIPIQVYAVILPDGRIWDAYGRAFRNTDEYLHNINERYR